jgi:tRNA nucleotidyltransferase (CCA-adding enzyme)
MTQIILTHTNTDFDALASLLAAARLYPDAVPVLVGTQNRNLRDFLALHKDELPFVRASDLPLRHIDGVILVDTQQMPPLEGKLPRLIRRDLPVTIIDHHPLEGELPPGSTYTGEPLGATTTLLVERLRARQVGLTALEATLLLLGIYEDTGTLTYVNTHPRDLEAAAWLLGQGASLAVADEFVNRPLTPQQQDLYAQLIAETQVEIVAGYSVLLAQARTSEYVEEMSTLAHKLTDLYDVDASFILVQFENSLQAIVRSRVDAIDVGRLLRPFGGGGHSQAAAALLKDRDLTQFTADLWEALQALVEPAVTAATLMTRQARTIAPDSTIAEAAEMLRRWGHEGLPVVNGERQLLGVLTRRDLDRALRLGLGEAPVRAYMRRGSPTVAPATPLARIQQVMREHNVGQLPVLENGYLVGIVTRTDVFQAELGQQRAQRASLAGQLEQALPPEIVKLLRDASEVAADMDFSLYIVGGFVRDLLLGTPNLDLDLVVEGDAIALARRLAGERGGRAKSHTRFGTAKWLVPEGLLPRLEGPSPVQRRRESLGDVTARRLAASGSPLALDFVTARTEFYERPAALPQVEAGSLRQDLYRRDFTINTMAICLDRDRYGELVDFYGGERDLEEKRLRVLHNLSFVEDATRILRAVRLEQRLDFAIEERTLELLQDGRDMLQRVSGERLRHELYLSLQEAEPERILARLGELGVLPYLHPALVADDWLAERWRAARQHLTEWRKQGLGTRAGGRGRLVSEPYPLLPVYLCLWLYRTTAEEMEGFISRLVITEDYAKHLRELPHLRATLPRLSANGLLPSQVYHLLEKFSLDVLYTAWLVALATSPPAPPLIGEGQGERLARQYIELFVGELRGVRPTIDGETLKRWGVAPGPKYRQALVALLDAKLDGQVTTPAEEEAFVRAQLGI